MSICFRTINEYYLRVNNKNIKFVFTFNSNQVKCTTKPEVYGHKTYGYSFCWLGFDITFKYVL
jgi:hypothetical protein